jgi:hypothetical protein
MQIMKGMNTLPVMGTLILALACRSPRGPEINLTSLLHDMTDAESITRFPDPAFGLYQSSSWDRAEKNKNDKASWFANKDYNYYIRIDSSRGRKEYVILDAKGPGAITRWWIPQEELLNYRTLRIYLDDNPAPAIEENYEKFVNGSSFVKWPFAFTSSDEKDSIHQYDMPVGFAKQMGAGFYLPLPFAKACEVTLDDSVFYYAIDYRLYSEGTELRSFSREEISKDSPRIDSAGTLLLAENPMEGPAIEKSGSLLRNQDLEMDLPAGPHAVEKIELDIHSLGDKQKNRGVVLMMESDGKQTVWSPVSEFFGGGVYARPVKNARVQMDTDGRMISHWVMPYQGKARITIKNFGEEPVNADLKIKVRDYRWDKRSMYFHADWHEEAPLHTPPAEDWNYIEIKGKGCYAGDILTVHSIPKSWWGEGDEKIYIDNDSFPNHLGTGMEDYYGYAWGVANFFSSPFISIPERDARGKDDWRGYNTMERMRLLDDIPFLQSLKVDMEAMNTQPGVSFSVTCFWYGLPGAGSNITPDEKTVQRKLMDFQPAPRNPAPGWPWPDPPENAVLRSKEQGPIRFTGDQLDLLAWRDPKVAKPLDPDGDNRIGSAGYILFGEKILNLDGFRTNTARTLPSFIDSLTSLPIQSGFGYAALLLPEHRSDLHVTGLILASGGAAEKGLVSFRFGENAPPWVRLGLMLDNADKFNKLGKTIWVTDSRGESSGRVRLAPSNRVPDWYFFDMKGIKKGDWITIHGSPDSPGGPCSIGGISFDLIKNE